MALTVAELAAAIRVGTSAAETAEVTRLKAYGETEINRFADGAPNEVKDEALVRIVGYLYDAPTTAYANAVQNSGAAAMLLPYRVHRAGIVSGAEPAAQPSGGGGSTPSGGGDSGGGASDADITRIDGEITDIKADIAALDTDVSTNTDAIAVASTAASAASTAAATAVTAAQTAQTTAETRGVDAGGTTGQILAKKSGTDYDTEWKDAAGTDVSNLAAQVEGLQHATRQVDILEVDKWKQGKAPNRVQVTVIRADRYSVNGVHNSTHWAAKIDNPHGITGNNEALVILRAQVHNQVRIPKSQLRLRYNDGRTNYYAVASSLELDSALAQSAWDYYSVQLFGMTQLIIAEDTVLEAQYHETEETVWGGEVSGRVQADAQIDDVDASTVADALVPAGGKTNEVLAKSSDTDYALKWLAGGGGGGFSVTKITENNPTISGNTMTFDATDAAAIWKANTDGKGLFLELSSPDVEGIFVPVNGENFTINTIRFYVALVNGSFLTARIARIRWQVQNASTAIIAIAGFNASTLNDSETVPWRTSQKAAVYSVG